MKPSVHLKTIHALLPLCLLAMPINGLAQKVEFYTSRTVRIVKDNGAPAEKKSLVVTAQPEKVKVTREENDTFRQLEIVRIGTCGGLQPYTPVGTYICSAISVGFDGLLNFYEGRNAVCDLPMERALLNHLGWSGSLCAPAPYAVHADRELVERIAGTDMTRGITVACGGFFGPQGRRLRIPRTVRQKKNLCILAMHSLGHH